jgi:hemerythrin-like domain-containing protein
MAETGEAAEDSTLPIERLQAEHAVIRQMIRVIDERRRKITDRSCVDPALLDAAVDFMRTYADLAHHGKEETILFERLAEKPMKPGHRKLMAELHAEHDAVRRKTTLLVAAKELHMQAGPDAFRKIAQVMAELAQFYPAHLQKEEERFFGPAMGYFTDDEKAAMREAMQEFDRNLIQEKYAKVVESLERA